MIYYTVKTTSILLSWNKKNGLQCCILEYCLKHFPLILINRQNETEAAVFKFYKHKKSMNNVYR